MLNAPGSPSAFSVLEGQRNVSSKRGPDGALGSEGGYAPPPSTKPQWIVGMESLNHTVQHTIKDELAVVKQQVVQHRYSVLHGAALHCLQRALSLSALQRYNPL